MGISFKAAAAAAISCCLLAACEANTDIETPPVAVTFKPGFDEKRKREPIITAVRAYLSQAEGDSTPATQVSGARCKLESREFEVVVTTPALVEMPTIKGKPSNLSVTCKGGDKRGTLVFEPFKPHTVIVGDPLSMLVGNIASAAVTAASDRWFYASIENPTVGAFLE